MINARSQSLFTFLFSHDPREESSCTGAFALKFGKFCIEFLLFIAQGPWGDNFYPDQQVSGISPALYAFTADLQRHVILNTRGHPQVKVPFIDRFDIDGCTKSCLCRTDLDGYLKIVTDPDKQFMGLDMHLDKQVTIGCTEITCLTLPLHAEAHTVVDSCRDMHGYFPFYPQMA